MSSSGSKDNKIKIKPGDKGIWATCARGMERKATKELEFMFNQYAEILYGIDSFEFDSEPFDDNDDIETSIKNEIASLKATQASPLCGKEKKPFQSIPLNLQCVLFFKINSIIDPVDFVHQICKYITLNPEKQVKYSRYINRLTPMTLMKKATQEDLEELSHRVLTPYFYLNHTIAVSKSKDNPLEETRKEVKELSSYAIRPTIRHHHTLGRDQVIKMIAASISDVHKVDLKNPDLVIIVDIYQTVCGMSVVAGKEWEILKRYNLAEL
ncbi:tRNA acetyltransferase TAN1 [Golovinomyces cichoracearum]|uniref:tRNA acetyltransferase TAN1 n=1 Tax=Golovinomyces cichoracearum TaxID=62708 RepID=A0A420J5K3_9PEZI|nr:tRNA acetyltransferase TAN1 [Golovinomyces cichoracearum]